TSVDELSAVSAESCSTQNQKPTPTTCIATSFEIPNRLQAKGMSNREPPATPAAPQALTAATTLNSNAVKISTWIPNVLTAANVRTVMVTAAPAMVMVAPRGIEIE